MPYIYIRGEFIRERERLQAAIDEAYEAKLIGKNNIHGCDFDFYVHASPCPHLRRGNSPARKPGRQEGREPRLKPPFPANAGLGARRPQSTTSYPSPSLGICAWAGIMVRRARQAKITLAPSSSASRAMHQSLGRRGDGHSVARVDRAALRRRARRLAQNLLAVIPGGSSVPCVPRLCARISAWTSSSLRGVGSGLGTAAVIVMDSSTQIGEGHRAPLLLLQARELRPVHALPRRHGLDVAHPGAHGRRPRRRAEIDQFWDISRQIEGHTICALGDAAGWLVQGLIRHFRHEIEARIDAYQSREAARAAAE